MLSELKALISVWTETVDYVCVVFCYIVQDRRASQLVGIYARIMTLRNDNTASLRPHGVYDALPRDIGIEFFKIILTHTDRSP